MHSNEFLVIDATGSPFDIGLAHGSKGSEKLHNSLRWYKERLTASGETDWDGITNFSRRYLKHIEKYDPDIIDEIKGIAFGAGVSFDDIVAINARTEILRRGKNLEGCTSFSVMPACTASGDTILGQNWDWNPAQKDAVFVLRIRQKEKPAICMITEGGLVGKIGFNSCGIGVCFNALKTDNQGDGVPAHVILRGILNADNFEDAVKAVYRGGIASSANYLISCCEGKAADIETDAANYDIIYPEAGILAHANHYVSPRLTMMEDYVKYKTTSSLLRHARINQLLYEYEREITQDHLKAILSDHASYPDSICRHEEAVNPPEITNCTVFSVIMNLNKREMIAAMGEPCRNKFSRFAIAPFNQAGG